MTLQEVIAGAQKAGRAVGHFNFCTIEGLYAIFDAAREVNVPVIVGLSEGERDFFGVEEAALLVRHLREKHNHPIFINADHTYSVDRVEEAARAGYDAVIFDGAKFPLSENIKETKESVQRAKEINPHILVEGELGYIGSSSQLLDEIPEGAEVTADLITKVQDAVSFTDETGVDLFAPSVGNIHGMLRHAKNPTLAVERISQISAALSVPLVLHGGSGTSDDDFRNAIRAGVVVVHINTEVRLAYRTTLEKSLADSPAEVAPYKILARSKEAMKEVVKARLNLFNNP